MPTEDTSKTDTRQVLIDAATEVFLKRGFSRATTKEIAQTAGLAEGTIYRHFDDKYALFHEVFLARSGETVEELARFSERAGQGTVRDNLDHLLRLIGRMAEHATSLMASMWADPEVAKRFEAYVRERAPRGLEAGPVGIVAAYIRAEQELGRIRGDVAADEAAAVVAALPFASAIDRALRDRLPTPGDFSAPRHVAVDILAQGLAPAAGASAVP
jgi:AcrR family transcriptional regulator